MSKKFQLSQQSSSLIATQLRSNSLANTVSCDRAIAICDFQCLLCTSRINGEIGMRSQMLNNHVGYACQWQPKVLELLLLNGLIMSHLKQQFQSQLLLTEDYL
uniref:Uncharacterized protein n=1 Tax=Micrurus lemniscatus lemniscatus TaxID=129467 RepID=A0A2D4JJT0_MICLE